MGLELHHQGFLGGPCENTAAPYHPTLDLPSNLPCRTKVWFLLLCLVSFGGISTLLDMGGDGGRLLTGLDLASLRDRVAPRTLLLACGWPAS